MEKYLDPELAVSLVARLGVDCRCMGSDHGQFLFGIADRIVAHRHLWRLDTGSADPLGMGCGVKEDEKAGKCSRIPRPVQQSKQSIRLHGQDTPWDSGPQQQHKEHRMETHEVLHMQAQLEDIRRQVNKLTSVQWLPGEEEQIQESLAKIWDTATALQQRTARPELVVGYRADALAQIGRVFELAIEFGTPTDQQLMVIGYACDLAQEKIKLYQHMANQAAQLNVLTGGANACSSVQTKEAA